MLKRGSTLIMHALSSRALFRLCILFHLGQRCRSTDCECCCQIDRSKNRSSSDSKADSHSDNFHSTIIVLTVWQWQRRVHVLRNICCSNLVANIWLWISFNWNKKNDSLTFQKTHDTTTNKLTNKEKRIQSTNSRSLQPNKINWIQSVCGEFSQFEFGAINQKCWITARILL